MEKAKPGLEAIAEQRAKNKNTAQAMLAKQRNRRKKTPKSS